MQVTRALTVLEPWAWLLVSDFTRNGHCVKPVENRTWPTSFRGHVAIHASSSWREVLDAELGQWLMDLHPDIAARLDAPAVLPNDPATYNMPVHTGCILGTVEIFDCIEFDFETDDFEKLCRDAGHGEWYDSHTIPPAEFANGRYCFLTRNPKQFTQPIPAKGAVNFWYLKSPELAAVAAALNRPLGCPVEYRRKLADQGKPAAMPNAHTFAKPRKAKAVAK